MMKDNKDRFEDVWGTVSTGRADCFVRKLTLPHLVRRQAKASRRIGDHIMTFSLLKKILLITFMISTAIFLALNNIRI